MIAPDWLRREVLKVHDATLICAPRISQVAGMAALRGTDDHVREFRAILARRRELICERLDRVDHVFRYVKPKGAYYVFPRIMSDHESSREFAIGLLNDARVTVTPGSAFGPNGEHHVRMAFCVDDDVINKAFDRIEQHFAR
jgi:aminotransferase